HPVTGIKIRVFIERIEILHAEEHWWKKCEEVAFLVRVRSEDNGGQERSTRLPSPGTLSVRSGETLRVERAVFEGYVAGHLGIEVRAKEHGLLDDDESRGRYVRVFRGDAKGMLGGDRPGDEAIDPEEVGAWTVRYRVELG